MFFAVIDKDERAVVILRHIANSIIHCIQMEADWSSRNQDKKIPILDMKVWLDIHSTVVTVYNLAACNLGPFIISLLSRNTFFYYIKTPFIISPKK